MWQYSRNQWTTLLTSPVHCFVTEIICRLRHPQRDRGPSSGRWTIAIECFRCSVGASASDRWRCLPPLMPDSCRIIRPASQPIECDIYNIFGSIYHIRELASQLQGGGQLVEVVLPRLAALLGKFAPTTQLKIRLKMN